MRNYKCFIVLFISLLIFSNSSPVMSENNGEEPLPLSGEKIIQEAIKSLKKADVYVWCLSSFYDDRKDNYVVTFSRLNLKGDKNAPLDKNGKISRKSISYTSSVHPLMKVYMVEKGTSELKLIYKKVINIPIAIDTFPGGFILVQHFGMGRRFGCEIYKIEGKKITGIFSEACDIIEIAFLPGEGGYNIPNRQNEMPFIFCTDHHNSIMEAEKPLDYGKYAAYTDVYKWNNISSKYTKIKKIKYSGEILFKDRFRKIKEGPVIMLNQICSEFSR